MTYQVVTNVTNYDAVLGYIKSFIDAVNSAVGGGGAWAYGTTLGSPTIDTAGPSVAGGRVLTVYGVGANNKDVAFGMRSTVSGPGNNCLYLFDGIGNGGSPPAQIATEYNITGNSGGAYFGYSTSGYSNANVVAGPLGAIRGFQQGFVGPYPSLWMFSNAAGDYLHFVLEIATGKYRHMHIGALTQFGTWPYTGGGYYAGMYWNQGGLGGTGFPISTPSSTQHMPPWDNNGSFADGCEWTVHYEDPNTTDNTAIGYNSNWVSPTVTDYNPTGTNTNAYRRSARSSVRGGFNRMMKNISESLFSGLVPLAPIVIGAVRNSDSPTTLRWIGQIPDVRMINMTNLTDGQVFSIGSDTWQVFSMASKNGSTGQENSAVAGYAYKQIP
jgi:hypothetical protein